jgi:colanic acid/amylovoran biosynthesis protein
MVNVILTGASLENQNRGGQALCWGAIEYISQQNKNKEIIISILLIGDQSDEEYSLTKEGYSNIKMNKIFFTKYDLIETFIERRVLSVFGVKNKNKLSKLFNNTSSFYNVNGGDSFSDIYGWKQFYNYAIPSIIAIMCKVDLVLLPQTIGPFNGVFVRIISRWILKNSKKVFIRDEVFSKQLDNWKIKYELSSDLSYFMKPQLVKNIDIKKGSVGINISGLMYFNRYEKLAGQFNLYPQMLQKIITYFQENDFQIYLIPHTYCLNNSIDDDDLRASQDFFSKIANKQNIIIIDQDYNAPQLKYIISNMNYFLGSRMHACFAALFTNVPTIGIAYSDKFVGSFRNFNAADNCFRINNMQSDELESVFENIKLIMQPVLNKRDIL